MTIMIIQFVKTEGLLIVCVATSTCRYDTERGSRRVKQFVCYGFVCCQENGSYLTPVFPKVIPFTSLACVANHRSGQKKPSHVAN